MHRTSDTQHSSPSTQDPAPPIDEGELFDLLSRLVDKSLVVYEQDERGQGRYRLLETVRQYARDRLMESWQSAAIRDRHLAFFSRLATQAERRLWSTDQTAWLNQLETEHDNLRAALEWCQAAGSTGSGQEPSGGGERAAAAGVRLAGTVWWFWAVRGYFSEGRKHLGELLALDEGAVPTEERAKALSGAGSLAGSQGDYETARALYQASLAIRRELGDQPGIAAALNNLGIVACDQGDYDRARSLCQEALDMRRQLGDEQGEALALAGLARVAGEQGDYASARSTYEQCLSIRRRFADRVGIGLALHQVGVTAAAQGDYLAAGELQRQSLAIRREIGEKGGIAQSLEALARLAAAQNLAARAARLFGAAEALRQSIGIAFRPQEREGHDRSTAGLRSALGEEEFAAAWAEGRAMALEQAIDQALSEEGIKC